MQSPESPAAELFAGMDRRGSVYDRIRSWLLVSPETPPDEFKGEAIGKKVIKFLYANYINLSNKSTFVFIDKT